LLTCIVAATGGLIFGYDIGISGKQNLQNNKFLFSIKLFPMLRLIIFIFHA
jgi:hypothetical protein